MTRVCPPRPYKDELLVARRALVEALRACDVDVDETTRASDTIRYTRALRQGEDFGWRRLREEVAYKAVIVGHTEYRSLEDGFIRGEITLALPSSV